MATQTSVGRDANSRPYHARAQECVHTRERVRARMPTCAHSYIFLGLELVIISHLQVAFVQRGHCSTQDLRGRAELEAIHLAVRHRPGSLTSGL